MGKWYIPSIFVDVISHSCANWTGGIALLYSRGGYPDSKVHPVGPRWAPYWSHELYYQGRYGRVTESYSLCSYAYLSML